MTVIGSEVLDIYIVYGNYHDKASGQDAFGIPAIPPRPEGQGFSRDLMNALDERRANLTQLQVLEASRGTVFLILLIQ